MSKISHEDSSRLLWLGRYTERVYTTLKYFASQFDSMIDSRPSSLRDDFAQKYCFDKSDPASVYSSLTRAYDNAIELRDELGTATFSYIQMAVYEMNKASASPAPLLQLQRVIDNIAAFWGMADDRIEDEHARSIVKFGKRIERVDLYARMKAGRDELCREIRRLTHRAPQTGLAYNAEAVEDLNALAEASVIDYQQVLMKVSLIL